ncbi:MAG: ketosteroid isomerase-like protein [Arenicella sp.]|jgi:ketosteroid isomerase-like protein
MMGNEVIVITTRMEQVMRIKFFLILVSLALLTASFAFSKDLQPLASDVIKLIDNKMDDFHDAADKGDKARYLNHFTEDSVFMGTDDWERWRLQDFSRYVDTHFKDGKGWSYTPIKRYSNFNSRKDIAWVDEILESKKWGRFRGTAVLEKTAQGWKLKHYSLSKLVPNESWVEVSEITKKAFAERAVAPGLEP